MRRLIVVLVIIGVLSLLAFAAVLHFDLKAEYFYASLAALGGTILVALVLAATYGISRFRKMSRRKQLYIGVPVVLSSVLISVTAVWYVRIALRAHSMDTYLENVYGANIKSEVSPDRIADTLRGLPDRIQEGYVLDAARVLLEIEKTYDVDELPKDIASLYRFARLEVVLAVRKEIGPPPFIDKTQGVVIAVDQFLRDSVRSPDTLRYEHWSGWTWTQRRDMKYWVISAKYSVLEEGKRVVREEVFFIRNGKVVFAEPPSPPAKAARRQER